jgi:hypothetical protein
MEQDDRYDLLNQRLTTLESKIESLTSVAGDLSSLSERLERLSNMESLLTRLEDNFSMISDVDIFGHLRDCLAEGNFKEADQETAKILFNAINKTADTMAYSVKRETRYSIAVYQ